MAEDTQTAGSSLTRTFGKVARHIFSPGMVIMMTAMAFPVVGAAAAAAGTTATLGDIALSTLDMYGHMLSAPFTDGGVLLDAFGSAANGDLAPGSYELGQMAEHGAYGAHESELLTGHLNHTGPGAAAEFQKKLELAGAAGPSQICEMAQDADFLGESFAEYVDSITLHSE